MPEIKPGPKPEKHFFGFLDESGLLRSPLTDKVFALGLLKLEKPSLLHKEIVKLKQKYPFLGEFKFANITSNNFKYYKLLVDKYFDTIGVRFSTLIFDKEKIDIKSYHQNDQFKAYNSFVAKLIATSLESGEYIVVIADDVTTPKHDTFEKTVKKKVKVKLRRNALFGIIRAESHAFCELQMVDILLGAVAYSFKIKYNLIKPSNTNPKLKLVKHIEKHLEVAQLSEKMERKMSKGRHFSIQEFVGLPKK